MRAGGRPGVDIWFNYRRANRAGELPGDDEKSRQRAKAGDAGGKPSIDSRIVVQPDHQAPALRELSISKDPSSTWQARVGGDS
jgi:hypothetical protein